eukprot:TRINITY_DN459_c0_g1_i1.p1 TRINITY_DN459_c0_g1~~TRINITY_DN459_c0_g1_i1.p1  ORF type:complete len:140 (-),score=15.89 TRINITY_DN459_c0_g1_i1:604-1023(-)
MAVAMKTAAVLLVVFMIVLVGESCTTPRQATVTSSADAGSGANDTTEEGEYSFTLPDYAAQLLRGDSGRTTSAPPTITVRGNPCEVECKCELVKCQGHVLVGQLNKRLTLAERREQLRGMRVCADAYKGCQVGCTRYNM